MAACNVLLGKNDNAKICDFGFARFISCEDVSLRKILKWMAPESITQSRFTIKSNVWSFNMLLMEIFSSDERLYKGISSDYIVAYLSSGHWMLNPTEYKIPKELCDVMYSCWRADPHERPTFENLSYYFQDHVNEK